MEPQDEVDAQFFHMLTEQTVAASDAGEPVDLAEVAALRKRMIALAERLESE